MIILQLPFIVLWSSINSFSPETDFRRKRRKRRTEDDHYTKDKAHTTSSTQTTTDDTEYTNITIVSYEDVNTQEKELQPYTEIDLEKRSNTFMESKHPHNDGKDPIGHNEDVNGVGIKKTGKGISTKYNDKQIDNDDEELPDEEPNAEKQVITKTLAPSGDYYEVVDGDDNTSGKIEHIITEQGDLYALTQKTS